MSAAAAAAVAAAAAASGALPSSTEDFVDLDWLESSAMLDLPAAVGSELGASLGLYAPEALAEPPLTPLPSAAEAEMAADAPPAAATGRGARSRKAGAGRTAAAAGGAPSSAAAVFVVGGSWGEASHLHRTFSFSCVAAAGRVGGGY